MTRTADRLSVAKAVASASVSWARRERSRTARPAANSGSTMIGIAASTKADSLGLVTDHHRDRADEHEEIAQRDRGRGAEGRLELRRVGGQARGDLAGLFRVEEAGIEPRQMGEEVRAQVRDDPLAERHDEIVARPGSDREHGDDAEHAEEIDADEAGVRIREAEVDHPPDRERHDQRRRRGDRPERRSAPQRSGRDRRAHRAEATSARRAGASGRPAGRRWRQRTWFAGLQTQARLYGPVLRRNQGAAPATYCIAWPAGV